MLESIGTAIIGIVEREIIKHSPEIQEMIIDQLDKLAKLIFDYVQGSLLDKSQETEQKQLNKD
jgi:hypothetical protein